MSFQFECETPMGKNLMVRRHRLHNGLVLVSACDHSAPIIAYQTWFAVGSRNESKGATGMAHFFEHLMFNQTTSLALGEFDRKIEATGGDSNAATWTDWTYYQCNVPASELGLIAKLESDRMTELLLVPETVEAEREVVINERLERVDEDIDGFISEELYRHAFDEHPYQWPTIGFMPDIEKLSIPQMETFYRKHYTPDNATLVVVGDFQEAELLATIESQYGDIPASGFSPADCSLEPEQREERVFHFRKEVASQRLRIGYKSPGQLHPDWAPLMFTTYLLASGPSAPLYRKLVIEEELASSIFCDLMPFADPSLVEISVSLTKDSDLGQVLSVIDTTLAKIAKRGPDERDIQKIANLVETEFWAGLTSMDGKAEAIGHYQCVHGDYRELFAMADRLAKVNAEDVKRVASIYLQPTRRTVLRITPIENGGTEA